MAEKFGGRVLEISLSGFSFENEYSFVNRIQSQNGSINVGSGLAATSLGLILEVASPPPQSETDPVADTPVLEFAGGTADEPGTHTLKVVENAAGFLFTDEEENIARLAPPGGPSVLVINGGRPEWFPVPDPSLDYLLGLDQEGNWKWYGALPDQETKA